MLSLGCVMRRGLLRAHVTGAHRATAATTRVNACNESGCAEGNNCHANHACIYALFLPQLQPTQAAGGRAAGMRSERAVEGIGIR